ncbi:replication endonuclease [Escherichia coli]
MEFVRDWQKPRPAIGREGLPVPETALDTILKCYRADEERALHAEEQGHPLAGTTIGNAIDKWEGAQERQEEAITLTQEARRHPPTLIEETLKELDTLPKWLRLPLIKHLNFLRRKQEDEQQKGKRGKDTRKYERFLKNGIPARLRRIREINARFAPLSFQAAAMRESLEELITLPNLSRERIQKIAVLLASAVKMHLADAMDKAREITGNDKDDNLNNWLIAYQYIGRRVLKLGITPSYWSALELRPDRRSPPDLTLVPGAVLRLNDAEWWNKKLRQMHDVWREELLRAAGLVSRQTSIYVSREALADFREKQARTRDFLKAHDVENEDGERISLEDIYYASTSNPHNRRNEMMACVKGMELIAQERGDVAFFVTVTAPSRFHSVTDAGTLNPKYKGTTVKDASDYLVYNFFASARKLIKKEKRGWYGIRTVEPHHDGTPHWHILVFTSPENEARITEIMCNAAIREDRAELGDDITPRFKCEKIDPEKGTPTSYIATYIGKGIDAAAFGDTDPKTGKPPVDHESGKPMADTVENAVAWARLHRIRQFQFFGLPSRQVWREFRRLAGQMARNPKGPQALTNPKADALLAAADVGCFASYIMHQGGVLIPRSEYLARTAYVTAEEPNNYGEFPDRIYGVRMPELGDEFTLCTHPEEWKLVRKEPESDDRTGEGFDLQGDPVAPWTRGNNCHPDEKTTNNSTQTEQSEWAKLPPLPPSSDGFVSWFKSLKRPDRKKLQRLLKKRTEESRQNASGGTDTPTDTINLGVVLPELPEIVQVRRDLEALGADFPEAMAHSVFMGARVRLGDGRTVHRDEQTGRITVTSLQPEAKP